MLCEVCDIIKLELLDNDDEEIIIEVDFEGEFISGSTGEEYQNGYKKGKVEGYNEGHIEGKAEGITEGYDKGKVDGHNEGYNQGKIDGITEGYNQGKTDGYNDGHEVGYIEGHKNGYDEAIELGNSHYDTFWDSQQDNGNRTNCMYLYSGIGWNDTTFNPKHSLQPKDAQGMFYRCSITDLSAIHEKFDFSKCSNVSNLVEASSVEKIGILDFSSVSVRTAYSKAFYNCSKLHTIEKLILNYNCIVDSSTFSYSPLLSHIIIEGTIHQTFTLNASTLDLESAKSVLLALKNYARTSNEFAYKITLSEGTWAVLDADGATAPHGGTWKDYVDNVVCWTR